MGIYDRDYSRESQPSGFSMNQRSMVVNIILINVAVYLVQVFTRGPLVAPGHHAPGWFSSAFSLDGDLLLKPWNFYQLLSYGFLHDYEGIGHLFGNMIGLFFLGRVIEQYLGRQRFLYFYLTAIVFSGAAWLLSDLVAARFGGAAPVHSTLVGASGGVVATIMLVVFYFPRQTVLLWFAIPVPLWLLGLLIVVPDLFQAISRSQSQVAYMAHLGGVLYAYLYFRTRWSFEQILPKNFSLRSFQRKTKLRVHRPPEGEDLSASDKQDDTIDEILRKIQQHGKDSLTRRERRLLEEASRRYQDRRR